MIRQICIFGFLVSMVAGLPQAPRPQTIPQPLTNPNPRPHSNQPYNRGNGHNAHIIRSENDNQGSGNYRWGYESDDHQTHQAEGRFEKAYPGFDGDALGVTGFWSYVDTDGKKVKVDYTAGVKGYRETRTYQ